MISAPFTPSEIAAINAHQRAAEHPLCCSHKGDGGHVPFPPRNIVGQLVATREGLICLSCDRVVREADPAQFGLPGRG